MTVVLRPGDAGYPERLLDLDDPPVLHLRPPVDARRLQALVAPPVPRRPPLERWSGRRASRAFIRCVSLVPEVARWTGAHSLIDAISYKAPTHI